MKFTWIFGIFGYMFLVSELLCAQWNKCLLFLHHFKCLYVCGLISKVIMTHFVCQMKYTWQFYWYFYHIVSILKKIFSRFFKRFFPSIKWKLILIFKFNSHVGLNFDRFLAWISSENTAKVESVTNKVIVRLHLPINFVRIKTLSFRNSLCASTLKVFISRQTFLEDLFVLI